MDKDALKVFYSRVFPFELLSKWVAYGDPALYERREFACEIDAQGSSVFRRHMSFATWEDMRREFCAISPMRIEIGPVYNHSPRHRDAHPDFAAAERELIFDIDMDSYDEVRVCCKGSAVCPRCWHLATTAIKVMEATLRGAFGFRSLLWVFSGRRGIHCWVADSRARRLANDAREAVISFMTVISGGQGSLSSRANLRFPLHPSIQRAYDAVLLPYFESRFMPDQGILEDAQSSASLLSFFPEELQKEIAQAWEGMRDPRAKWQTLKNFAEKRRGKQGLLYNSDPVASIVMAYTYPRFDANVTKVINHLLKSPFCVHPGTGRISVPIDPMNVDDFTPEAAPTLSELLKDIDEFDTTMADEDKPATGATSSDLHKTRLSGAVRILEKFIDGLSKQQK